MNRYTFAAVSLPGWQPNGDRFSFLEGRTKTNEEDDRRKILRHTGAVGGLLTIIWSTDR